MTSTGEPTILVTIGDPAGIGPEVIKKALNAPELPDDFVFELVGDPEIGVPGVPTAATAQAAHQALLSATERLVDDPQVAGIVTGPVSKAALETCGFPFPGQTEFFADAFGCRDFAMCLSGSTLTVALATIHIPLSKVASLLDKTAIIKAGRLLAAFAGRHRDGQPRIAVAGLNPHAGEAGKFGTEEREIIEPAIDELNQLGVGIFSGPGVPDAIFRDVAEGRYDGIVAMYHDQGLIPLKLLDFDDAVNVTLGLPKPRTSPDHGTAFDIAGKGLANHKSMLRAMIVAAEMARRS